MDAEGTNQIVLRRQIVKREIIRVEPFDSNFEKWGVPVSTCTRAGDMIFVSGLPPFDPKTGELLVHAPFEQQAERCLEELKTALEAAGSDLEHVLKVNVLCVSRSTSRHSTKFTSATFPRIRQPAFSSVCRYGRARLILKSSVSRSGKTSPIPAVR
jgi:2-iminobutanoate/2-iminopropanoate deaminase